MVMTHTFNHMMNGRFVEMSRDSVPAMNSILDILTGLSIFSKYSNGTNLRLISIHE